MRSILQKRSLRFDTFYFFATFLQVALGLAVGAIASRISLAAGVGAIAAGSGFDGGVAGQQGLCGADTPVRCR